MQRIWYNKHRISEQRRLTLYNTLVLPILLYNCATWSLTKKQLHKLDTFHRKQLRRIIGIRWPNKISNIDLYTKCKCSPLSDSLQYKRLKQFGHVLRRDINTPAQLAMTNYFKNTNKEKYRGRAPSNIQSQTNKDIQQATTYAPPYADHTYSKRYEYKLENLTDLDVIRDLANNRQLWKNIIK